MSLTFLAAAALAAPAGPVALKPGQTLRTTTSVRRGVYRLPNGDETGRTGAVVIRGNNLTIDFGGATLRGSDPTVAPNERKGTGIYVEGRNITLKNVRVHGYKLGLVARNSPGLRILDSDFSYNWKQRLLSGRDREDTADWMSFHRNEKDEWLRFGAGMYLRNCDGFEVKGTVVRGGQCGLMIMESDHGLVWNNDFSFNSAVGFGMYLSSDNRIMHNRMDWNVRGYSHGIYNRGQDSTGVLIYEQCHRNVFAYNSVTHSGDGFFLWAGQTSMDTGQGGCNDNLLYGNDWSHAPTNGIEATFSRNRFVNNLLLENWHGVWGGYSFDTLILGNVFGLNGEAIAIEHGQRNVIRYNSFERDHIGVFLWQNARQDPNWGYPKFRDTRNVGTVIERNRFLDNSATAVELGTSAELRVTNNLFERNARVLRTRPYEGGTSQSVWSGNQGPNANIAVESVTHAVTASENALTAGEGPRHPEAMLRSGNVVLGLDPETADYLKRFQTGWNPWPNRPSILPPHVAAMLSTDERARAEREVREHAVAPLPGGMNPFLKDGTLRGRRYILVDEWGPYDFQRPILWLRGVTALGGGVAVDAAGKQTTGQATTTYHFEILGPQGKWRVKNLRGATLSAQSGSVPGKVTATMPAGRAADLAIELEYTGAATTDVRGVQTPAGRPVAFGFSQFFAPIDWTVRFYEWKVSENPSDVHAAPEPKALAEILKGTPLREVKTDRLEYAGAAFLPGLPSQRTATVAEGTFTINPGDYVLEVTTDDGARVWVDGKEVIQGAWKYQGPTPYTVNLKLGGTHRIRVEHFQIDGYAALKVNLRRR